MQMGQIVHRVCLYTLAALVGLVVELAIVAYSIGV